MSFPLLDDPESEISWGVCRCLHAARDERTVSSFIRVLQRDPSPQVRGEAASALGEIGSPVALPALIASVESDYELDMHGFSASTRATAALDEILGTNESRIRLPSGNYTIRRAKPDLDLLGRLANELFEQWSSQGARAGKDFN